MIKAKSPKGGQWQKNEGRKLQQHPKATFDILMAKYKEGRASFRDHKNQAIQNTRLNNPVYLGQASASTIGSSSGKRYRTLPQQNSKGQDHRQQDYHPAPYFLVRPPMPGLWGPPPMMYPPCPPWAGWYGPWAPSLMHFHPRWLGPTEDFGYGGYYAGDSHYRYISH
jgi:hypothetical protein